MLERKKTQKNHIELQYQRRKTQSSKSLLEQWLDDYWLMNVKNEGNVSYLESAIHQLVQMLLEVGDDQLRDLQGV